MDLFLSMQSSIYGGSPQKGIAGQRPDRESLPAHSPNNSAVHTLKKILVWMIVILERIDLELMFSLSDYHNIIHIYSWHA